MLIDHKYLFYYFNKQSKIKPIIIIYLSTKNNLTNTHMYENKI